MNESKTNHAVMKPDALFKERVATKMNEIQDMINAPTPNRDAIDATVFGLKKTVRGKDVRLLTIGHAVSSAIGLPREK